MKKHLASLSVALLLLLGYATPEAHAGPKDLLGDWLVKAVEIKGKRHPSPPSVQVIISFKAGGKLLLIMKFRGKTHTKKGTFKVKGKNIQMTMGGNTDTIVYSRKGNKLTLANAAKGEKSFLQKK